MQTKIFTSAYFAPVEYFAHLAHAKEVIIESNDNFQKQTYRNRCYIYGANGKLLLNLPVRHNKADNGKLKTAEAEIAEQMKWKKIHWKSIQSAYQTSPYFEFYEDELKPIFEKEHANLLDLNLETVELIRDLIQAEWEIKTSEEYKAEYSNAEDLREKFNPKKEDTIQCPHYIQVFSDKHGFINNLSILDLLFNEGPNTLSYLENINI